MKRTQTAELGDEIVASEVLNPNDVQGFVTTKEFLAFSLYIAGLPWIDPSRPLFNTYTFESVFRLGGGKKDESGNIVKQSRFSGGGWEIEDAAETLQSENVKGKVEYHFRMNKTLSVLLKAFDDQKEELEKNENVTSAELQMRLAKTFAKGEMSEEEYLLRSTYISLKTYADFKHLWKQFPPMVKLDKAGKPVIDRNSTATTTDAKGNKITVPATKVTNPGCIAYSVNISEATRKRLGLKPRNKR